MVTDDKAIENQQMNEYYRRRHENRKKAIKKRRRTNFFTLLFILIAVAAVVVIWDNNSYHIDFDTEIAPEVNVEYGGEYKSVNVDAVYRNLFFNRKGVPVKVECVGEVNASLPGVYEIKYTASYKGKTKTEMQTVKVVDTTAPKIELFSNPNHFTIKGTDYIEEGYMATDNCDGNITDKVTRTEKDGVVTYTVKDSSGNKADATRKIVYKTEEEAKQMSGTVQKKTVYLTFDDGPGKYTKQLLDVLDKYGAKVTFFVTNQFPDYQNMIAEESKRGHTVGIHTYSHNYEKVYSSDDAYFDDLAKMSEVIKKQTGKDSKIVRLPGGSSNLISENYSKGIITRITKSLEAKGYKYCDWNVESMDAGGAKTSEEVAQNVIEGLKENDVSVVLQHDIHGFSVEAVESILSWGRDNGYSFLAMDRFSPTAHHKINN